MNGEVYDTTGGVVKVNSFDEAIAYLDNHVNLESKNLDKHDVPTLDRMKCVAHFMADPQFAQPVIQLTGTNGKGSTAAIITALLMAHDLSVGTYTSPDLGRVNDRMKCNGEPIGDEALTEILDSIQELEKLAEVELSRFEVLTLAGFRWFAEMAVDVAIVEVGMGGRWDATNIADATVAVITNISNDHLDILGPTTKEVAIEKVGIVKPGATLIMGELEPSLLELVVAMANDQGAATLWKVGDELSCSSNDLAVGGRLVDLNTPGGSYESIFLPLHGAHQAINALLALAAVEAFFGRSLDDNVVRHAFANVEISGRFEIVGRQPLVVVDGAHNPAGALAAIATLADFHTEGYLLVLGMNAGRDPKEMLEALEVSRARLLVACEPDSPRAMPAHEIAKVAQEMGVETLVVPRVKEAMKKAASLAQPNDAILVTGPLYVVAETLR